MMSKSLKKAMTLIGIFYLIMFSALGYILAVAFSTHQDVMDTAYYEKGLDYQKILDRRAKAKSMGFSLADLPSPDKVFATGTHPLVIKLNGPVVAGTQIEGTVKADLRAGGAGQPALPLVLKNGNELHGEMHLPRAGYWDVFFKINIGEQAELVERRNISVGNL